MFKGGTDQASEVSALDVRDLSDRLSELVGALQPDDVPLPDAFPMWEEFQMVSRLAGAAATLMVRKVDEPGQWKRDGFRNVDDFLAHHSGGSPSDARRTRKASEQLKNLPDTRDQFQNGDLSEDQAREISDAATNNPDAEKKLLDNAKKKSLKDLRDDCGRAKTAGDPDPDATHRRNHANRRARCWVGTDQAFQLQANASTLDGHPIQAALDRITDDLFHLHRRSGLKEHREAYMFDALRFLAQNYLDELDQLTPNQHPEPGEDSDSDRGGDRGEGGAPQQPGVRDRKRHGRMKYQGIIRLDLAALVRGWVEGDELCEITGLGPIPINQARALLGESVLHLVLTNGSDVQNVTYLGRGPNAAQNIALLWSQPACQNIRCPHLRTEHDHRDDWARTHITRLDSTDQLCDHDHDLKTLHGWSLVPGTGRRPFVPPHNPNHPNNTPPDAATDSRAGPAPPDTRHAAPRAESSENTPPELFPDTS
jgi:polyhydroxyalkanoate synthesis regulator phasin